MIADAIYHNGEAPTIYTRWRDERRELHEKRVSYRPHFYVPAGTTESRLDKMLNVFAAEEPSIDKRTIHKGVDGANLWRIECDNPYAIKPMRESLGVRTYEGDVSVIDQYLIENVPKMPEWKPRKWWYDIECNTGDDKFTTVIAVIDSDLPLPRVFAWADEQTNCPYGEFDNGALYTREVRGEEYILTLYRSEKKLYDGFIEFLNERNPDMMIAHAGTFFDIPHMAERLDKIHGYGGSGKLSPVGIYNAPRAGKRMFPDAQPIVGRWQFDTAAPESSGTGFERVWKDSGGGQLPDRKLNTIAETLGLGSKLTEEIEGMTVHNGWYEYWSEFVDYCLLDTVLLRGIDEARNVTDFFVEMVRLTGVSLKSVSNVSNFARGLISRRTDMKAPTRYQSNHDSLKGAEFIRKENGLYEGVAVVDYKGLYPSLMSGYNLSWETKRHGPGEGIIEMENGTFWDQTERGILPQIVDYLFDYRAICKQKMRDAETKEVRAAWNTTQSAVKRVMASLYGMTAHVGYGWSELDVAETILSEGRRCIALLDSVATNMGYNVLYGFTDSAFIQVPFDEAKNLALRITERVQEVTGNEMLIAELEAYMPYWLLAGKNMYAGKVSYPPEDEGKMKTARFGKGSDEAPISRGIQRDVLDLICSGAPEADVRAAVLDVAMPIRNGEVDLKQVTKSTRLSKPVEQYNVLSGASKAAHYYNTHINPDEPLGADDSVKWTYVSAVPLGKPQTAIIAYRDPSEVEGFELDIKTIVEKNIHKKVKTIFDVMGWDVDAAIGTPRPAQYW